MPQSRFVVLLDGGLVSSGTECQRRFGNNNGRRFVDDVTPIGKRFVIPPRWARRKGRIHFLAELFCRSVQRQRTHGRSNSKDRAESYTVLPNIIMSEKTSRLRGSLNYSPGFVFYHPTTELNQVTQNALADFQYRLTPHTTVGAQEMFQQNSSVLSEPYTIAGATVSESGSASSPLVVLPYLGQTMDSTTGHISYQLSRNSMVSASGYYSLFDYSNSAQSEGFYNSHGGGGSGSFSRRLGRTQFFGVSYRYAVSDTTTYSSTTESQFATAFYSIRLPSHFSLSFNGGPEYTSTTAPWVAPFTSWAPSGTASVGWQRNRADFALSYSHEVTTGWGLLGPSLRTRRTLSPEGSSRDD